MNHDSTGDTATVRPTVTVLHFIFDTVFYFYYYDFFILNCFNYSDFF